MIEDPLPDVAMALASSGREVKVWSRRVSNARTGEPWPPGGPFQAAALRLPRGREELSMGLHAAASVLRPGGMVLVYGAKDEGIQAALTPLEGLFPGADTLAIGGRCRVLKGTRPEKVDGLKGSLSEWKTVVDLRHPEVPSRWVSYPGVFAHGRLDPGTRLLLDALPCLTPGARVLDYGCGSGVVGHVAGKRGEKVKLEMLDVDAVALEAARENVPGATAYLSDGLPSSDQGPFDAIFSNPPFHRGKEEDPGLVLSFVREAPHLLRKAGRLVFVAQRRIMLEPELEVGFREVGVLAEDSVFRVWQGAGPRKTGERRRLEGVISPKGRRT